MKLLSEARFVDESVKLAFYKLEDGDSSEKELFKLLNQALDNIEQNAFCGIQLPKMLIPKEYLQKFGVENLWKCQQPLAEASGVNNMKKHKNDSWLLSMLGNPALLHGLKPMVSTQRVSDI